MKLQHIMVTDAAIQEQQEIDTSHMDRGILSDTKDILTRLRNEVRVELPLAPPQRAKIRLGFPDVSRQDPRAAKFLEIPGLFCLLDPLNPVPVSVHVALSGTKTLEQEGKNILKFLRLSIFTNQPPKQEMYATAEHIFNARPCVLTMIFQVPADDFPSGLILAMPPAFGAALFSEEERLDSALG